jgi:probable addiction module antidote protein
MERPEGVDRALYSGWWKVRKERSQRSERGSCRVVKAGGMSAIAERAGLGRESLYKALTPGAKPRYDTVLKVLHSLGVKLTVSAA